MVYRINRTVIYNPDDGTLTLVDDSDQDCVGEISLTPTANRLLHLLIMHQGSVIEREALLEHVWDNYGLKSSNNSLNQYVSMLRRNFADLGLEEAAIVTVPRTGFMFSQDLEIVTEAGQSPPVSPPPLSAPAPDISPLSAPEPQPPSARRTSKARLLLAALALVTVANLGYLLYHMLGAEHVSYEARYLTGELHGCPVYSFYRSSANTHKATLAEVEHQMKLSDLSCPAGSEIYYRLQDAPDDRPTPIPFVSVCYPLADGRYAKCHSSYAY
ncbi:winged helix-turn-helix domain-containing protein [uncultured Pluralibacter sp.]|uniref:winged helix-turn-helix domain-containing protein n=1 Tax=uncultured Pluralibacter sp. TaxID=1490864 RepID=UPI0026306130|nr:winged helix-turn-helix domain-containing protein [uncultured Pluralibacter sp.]